MDGRIERVQIDFRKWDGSRHWQFSMSRLGEDEHGLWLWSPPGSNMQRGHEPMRQSAGVNVKLIPDNKWWTAMWNAGLKFDLYVDIITPPSWNGSTVTMIDIDLDVKRWADGHAEVVDEDEFEEHRVAFDYPERLIDTARATAARLALAVEERHEPFGDVGDSWVRTAVNLAELSDG